jgi:hypothetical protein
MNKYEKALQNINADVSGIPYFHKINTCTNSEDVEAIKELVERSIAKKVIYDVDGDEICPDCKSRVHEQWKPKHCEDCGKALDWTDK